MNYKNATILFVLATLAVNTIYGQISNPGSLNEKSFYQSKEDWQTIIDTTWGAGLPLEEKLRMFDTYADLLTKNFDGFQSLGITIEEWDSIKQDFRFRIDSTTSRGAFSGIMSRFTYQLNDGHTHAMDSSVIHTPVYPGTPLLVVNGFATIENFGAVLTVLDDNSIIVLRTIEDHPLGLEPGDEILGYEGVEWRQLLNELLASNMPMLALQRGAPSAISHNELVSVGMNWHLFETMDVLKYSTNEVVHLPVEPLTSLPVTDRDIFTRGDNFLWNNEQLPIEGVPFPSAEEFFTKGLTYGIVEGTNVGYVYLYVEANENDELWDYDTDPQFWEAISSFVDQSSKGIIIDLRWNHGGWATYNDAFFYMFNESFNTLLDYYRCSPSSFDLCPGQNESLFSIFGGNLSYFDHPIAVLLGPNCVSMGDITAYMLTYHSSTQTFGKPTTASLGDNRKLDGFPGWDMRYSVSDMIKLNSPDTFLNRREFPIDHPVWFNKDDVANGVDPVVEAALDWISEINRVTSIDNDLNSIFSVYPNPSRGEITIDLQDQGLMGHIYQILGVSGEVVQAGTIEESKFRLDLGDIQNGTYFFQVRGSDDQMLHKKLIKTD